MKKKLMLLLLALCLLLTGCAQEESHSTPTSIVVWHYYSGSQQEAFQAQVDAFNHTVGLRENIVVTALSKSNISKLYESVADSFAGKVGAEPLPDAFSAYSDGAWDYVRDGKLTDLSAYFTEDELKELNSSYLKEGQLSQASGLYIFPIQKSSEALYLNWTAWEPFAAACGVTTDDLATWEGVADVAAKYYAWSNGRHFFGRDAYANYLLVGSTELGEAMFQTNGGKADFHLNREILRRMWDHFVVPYAKGYYNAAGRYRSDDMKTGDLIAFVGATSSASFTPTQVTDPDGNMTDIEVRVLEVPSFAGVEQRCAVQQGAGMVVVKSDETRERAAATFLRYLTEPEANIAIALKSGYMPVRTSAASSESIRAAMEKNNVSADSSMGQTLLICANTLTECHLVYTPPFENVYQARNTVEDSLLQNCADLRKSFDAAVASGLSREEAVVQCLGDDAFDAWYTQLSAALSEL